MMRRWKGRMMGGWVKRKIGGGQDDVRLVWTVLGGQGEERMVSLRKWRNVTRHMIILSEEDKKEEKDGRGHG
jgi:hypothetical protein